MILVHLLLSYIFIDIFLNSNLWSYFMLQFLSQRKKLDAEERRIKQKKAREEFKKMLEVCSLLGWKFLQISGRNIYKNIHIIIIYS